MSRETIRHAGLRSDPLRAGMTLTEVLFASGILALGVLGVMSLVPSAMYQVSVSAGNTLGAAIAKNALIALQNGQIDLVDYADLPADTVLFATSYRGGLTVLDIPSDSPLVNYNDWPQAVYAYHREAGRGPVGNGVAGVPSFQIPGDTSIMNTAAFDTSTWSDLVGSPRTPPFVPAPWAPGYGWTATLLPISADDDGDMEVDEDTAIGASEGADDDGDDLIDEDDLIMPATAYYVQLAVWRYPGWKRTADRMYIYHGGTSTGITGSFTDGSAAVTLDAPIPRAAVGDYIRMDAYGVWYRIAAISDPLSASPTVTLAGPFTHPAGPALPTPTFSNVNVSIASDFKLMGLYEGVIEPAASRNTP